MRQILSRSLLTVAAASSILAVTGGYASADSDAQGGASGSPGVLSGNSVQVPVDVPVNACGNTVDVVAADNPSFGNHCANVSQHESHRPSHSSDHRSAHHSAAAHSAGAAAEGDTEGSPGVLSGNSVKIPVHAPVNACGNTVDVVALLNSASGNSCANGETPAAPVVPGPRHAKPPAAGPRTPVAPPAAPAPAAFEPHLAETGTSAAGTGAAAGGGAVLLLGGALLYRRGTRVSRIRRTYS